MKRIIKYIIFLVIITIIITIYILKNSLLSILATPSFLVTIDDNDINNFQTLGKIITNSYEYNINNGNLFVKGIVYNVKIADDGVLQIYKGNTLYAQSKNQLDWSKASDSLFSDSLELRQKREQFIHRGNRTANQPPLSYDKSVLRTYARNNTLKYKNYSDDSFNDEDYKYLTYAYSSSYNGIDFSDYDKNLYDVYVNEFKNIIYDLSLKTTILLDKKISAGGEITLIKNGKYLVNTSYGKYLISDKGASKGGSGIVVPKNTTVDLNGSTIKQIYDYTLNWSNTPSTQDDINRNNKYRVFKITSGSNITIKNGILVGDKAEVETTPYAEQGTGIYIYSVDNISTVTIDKKWY